MSFEQINRFASLILRMASHIEDLAPAMHKLRLTLAKDDSERQQLEQRRAEWRGPLSELAAHAQFFTEVFIVRHVENYLSYLSALLFDIFAHRPEAMRSQEKVELEFVLEHKSRESLIRGLAERKVEALSYSSFERLVEFFQDHFHLAICSQGDLPTIREYVETRNISVHNRCIVNRRYLEKIASSTWGLGARRDLGIEDLETLVPILHKSVVALDREARRKLRLKGGRFSVDMALTKQFESAHARLQRRLAKKDDAASSSGGRGSAA